MRKLFFLLAFFFVAACVSVSAQTVSLTPQNNDIDVLMANKMRYLGQRGGMSYYATYNTRQFMNNYRATEIKLLALDENMRVVKQLELPNTKESHLIEASLSETGIYLLYVDEEKKQTNIYRAAVDVESLQLVGAPKVLYHLEYEKKDVTYLWHAASENKEFFGLVFAVGFTVSGQMTIRQVLFDDQMNSLWEKEYPVEILNEIALSNDGEMLLLGYRCNEDKKTTEVDYVVLDVDDHVFRTELDMMAIDLRVLNFVNGKAVLGGLFGQPGNCKTHELAEGVVGVCYDTRAEKGNVDKDYLTQDEVNVMYNLTYSRRQKEPLVDAMACGARTQTAFGGAMAYNRLHSVTVYSNGAVTTHYYQEGTLVIGVDTTGSLMWHKPIRCNMHEVNFYYHLDVALLAHGDDVVVLQSEPTKTSPEYYPAGAVKQAKVPKTKSMLAIYAIEKKGEVTKQVAAAEGKWYLSGSPAKIGENQWRVQLGHNKSSRQATIKF